jgi:hypothetical protein
MERGRKGTLLRGILRHDTNDTSIRHFHNFFYSTAPGKV